MTREKKRFRLDQSVPDGGKAAIALRPLYERLALAHPDLAGIFSATIKRYPIISVDGGKSSDAFVTSRYIYVSLIYIPIYNTRPQRKLVAAIALFHP